MSEAQSPPRLIRCAEAPDVVLPVSTFMLVMGPALLLGGLAVLTIAPVGQELRAAGFGAVFIGAWFNVIAVSWEIAGRVSRRKVPAAAAARADWGDEADAFRHVARVRGRRESRPVDAAAWLRDFGPGALSLGVPVPPFDDGTEPVSEPVDVGPGRRRRRWREQKLYWGTVVIVLGVLIVAMGWVLSGMPLNLRVGSPLLQLLLYAPLMLAIAAQLGYRPVELTSVIAEPGLVRVASWGRTFEFCREDSVLVLEPMRGGGGQVAVSRDADRPGRRLVKAWLVRRDGRRWAEVYQGHDDPGLCDLYYRWMAEPMVAAGARPQLAAPGMSARA